jgi:hypothetical protein
MLNELALITEGGKESNYPFLLGGKQLEEYQRWINNKLKGRQ